MPITQTLQRLWDDECVPKIVSYFQRAIERRQIGYEVRKYTRLTVSLATKKGAVAVGLMGDESEHHFIVSAMLSEGRQIVFEEEVRDLEDTSDTIAVALSRVLQCPELN